MKISSLIFYAPLLGVAVARAILPRWDGEPWADKFVLRVGASQYSPIDEVEVQAANTRFWVGGSPKTHCPNKKCPDPDSTVIKGKDFKDYNHLDVGIKGGQKLYIDPDAALRFTTSEDEDIPEGSYTGGYTLGYTIYFHFDHWGASGRWLACSNSKQDDRLQIFADVSNVTVPDCENKSDCCQSVFLKAHDHTGPSPPVYQYT